MCGGVLTVGQVIGHRGPRNNHQCELPRRLPFWKNLDPLIRAEKPQAKEQTGEEHSSTHHQTGCLKSFQAHSCLKSHPETKPHPPEGEDSAPPTSGKAPVPSIRNRMHKQEFLLWCSRLMIWLVSGGTSLIPIQCSGLRIQHYCSCGIGRSCGSA